MYRLNNVQRVAIWNEQTIYPKAFEVSAVTDAVYYGMKAINISVPANPTQAQIDELILQLRDYDESGRTSDSDRIAVTGAVYSPTCEKVLKSLLKYDYFPAAWTQMDCVAEPNTIANLTDLLKAAKFMMDIVEWDHRMTGDTWTDDYWYPPVNASSSPGTPYVPILGNVVKDEDSDSSSADRYDEDESTAPPYRDSSSSSSQQSHAQTYGSSTAPLRKNSFLSWTSLLSRSQANGDAGVTREALAASTTNTTENSTTLIASAEVVYQELKGIYGDEPHWTIPITMAAGEVLHKVLQSANTKDTELLRSALARFTAASFIGPIGFSIFGQNNAKDVILLQLDDTNELQIVYPLGAASASFAFPAPVFRDRIYTYNYLHTGAEITLGAICAVLTLISLALGVFLIIYQDIKPLAAASPLFMGAILIGSIFIYSAFWTWLPQSGYSPASCHLRYWLLGLGFVFLFGSLFAKSWRIMRLFDPSGNIFKVTNQQLALAVGSFVIVEVILLAVWSGTANPKVIKVVMDPLRPRLDKRMCHFGAGNLPMLILIVIYNLGLLIYGIYTTIKIWNVPLKLYNESREIAFSMYNLLCFSVLAFALQASATVPDPSMFIIRSVAFMTCAFLAVCAIFGPKIINIIIYGLNGPPQESAEERKPSSKSDSFHDSEANPNSPSTNGNVLPVSSPRESGRHAHGGSSAITTATTTSRPEKNSDPARTTRRSPTQPRHDRADHSEEHRNAYEYRGRHSSSSGTIAEENTGDFGFSRYSDDDDYFTDEDRKQRASSSSGPAPDPHGDFPEEDVEVTPMVGARVPSDSDSDGDSSFDFRKRDGGKEQASSRRPVETSMPILLPVSPPSSGKEDTDDDSGNDSDSSDDSYPPPGHIYSLNSSSNLHQSGHQSDSQQRFNPIIDVHKIPIAPSNDYCTTEDAMDSARSSGRSAAGRGRANTPSNLGSNGGSGEDTPRLNASGVGYNGKMRRFTVSGRTSGSESYSPRESASKARSNSRDASQSARGTYNLEDDDDGVELTLMGSQLKAANRKASKAALAAAAAVGASSSAPPSVTDDFKSAPTASADTPQGTSPVTTRKKRKKKKTIERKRYNAPGAEPAAAEPVAEPLPSKRSSSKKQRNAHPSEADSPKARRHRNKHVEREGGRSPGKEDSDEVDDYPIPPAYL